MTESSDSFQTTEPPAPTPEQPKRRKRGSRALLLGVLAVVVVAGLGVGAWWAITNYNELNDTRADLEATQGELAALQTQSSDQIAEIAELESQSAGLQSDLDDRTTQLTELRAQHNQLTADHAQLVTESGALTADNADLSAALDSVNLDLALARDMTAAMAAYVIPVGDSFDTELPDSVLALRDELAELIGWFDETDDYDLGGSLGWTRFMSAVDDVDDEALSEAFHAFADASYGSQEWIDTWAEWMTRFYIDALQVIDQALQTTADALAE